MSRRAGFIAVVLVAAGLAVVTDPGLDRGLGTALAAERDAHTASAPDSARLDSLLRNFLDGASRSDPAVHEWFWAEDLVYTSSSGRRVGKDDILRDAKTAPPRKPGEPVTRYTAEDVRIRQYGDCAVVAFRLVGTTVTTESAEGSDGTTIRHYLNTGTFLRRGGTWQVVAWQATAVPESTE